MEWLKSMWDYVTAATFLGQELWRYGVFLKIVLAALVAGVVINVFFKRVLERIAGKTETKLDDLVLAALRWPLKLVVYTLALRYSARLFTFPGNPEFQAGFRRFFESASLVLIGLIVAVVLVKIVDIIIAYVKPRVEASESTLDDQLLPIMGKLAKIFALTLLGLLVLQNLGYNVTSLIAGLGIGGLAVALAAQETLSNIFGSIAIFADKPFAVGDRVQVEGCDGPVESVGMRSTRIRTLDGTLVTVPNAKMSNATINNVQARPFIKKLFTINLTYDTGFEKMQKALEILREVFGAEENFENHWVYFSDFAAHSLDILCIVWCTELRYEEYLKIVEGVNLDVLRRFDAEGIEFAFPTQTLYHKSGAADLHEAMAAAPAAAPRASRKKKTPRKES